jgi:hypothetical protein
MSRLNNLFDRRASAAAGASHRVRPRLEELESRDVPSYLAAEFPGQGVWRYDYTYYGTYPPFPVAGSWRQLTANNASLVAADRNGDVVAAFPGQGVWLYRGGTWQEITANNGAVGLDIAFHSVPLFPSPVSNFLNTIIVVVAEFPGQGLWRYSLTTAGTSPAATANWMELTANDASTEAIDLNGVVAATFRGWGVWRFADNTGWQQLNTADATSLAIGANTTFGPPWIVAALTGQGVWRFLDGTGWQQLSTADASTVATEPYGYYQPVIAEFPGSGVWYYWSVEWIHATAADACLVGFGDNYYVGQFPGAGIWVEYAGLWQQITANNPSSFSVGCK